MYRPTLDIHQFAQHVACSWIHFSTWKSILCIVQAPPFSSHLHCFKNELPETIVRRLWPFCVNFKLEPRWQVLVSTDTAKSLNHKNLVQHNAILNLSVLYSKSQAC